MPIAPTEHIWMSGEPAPFQDAIAEAYADAVRGRADRYKTWNEYVHG